MVWLTDGELLINVVMHSKPKVMTGLNQKVRGKDQKLPILLTQTTQPPAERQSLTHPGTHAERGNPVPSPRRESVGGVACLGGPRCRGQRPRPRGRPSRAHPGPLAPFLGAALKIRGV